jgi:hypothetical protein
LVDVPSAPKRLFQIQPGELLSVSADAVPDTCISRWSGNTSRGAGGSTEFVFAQGQTRAYHELCDSHRNFIAGFAVIEKDLT